MSLILDFSAIDATMSDLVGGKAANLGELTRAGFPVPRGFCLTTDAFRVAAVSPDGPGPTPEQLRRRWLEAPVPREIRDAVVAEYDKLGGTVLGSAGGDKPSADVPVAVRSSATAEDLPFASFAGQQDTFLNVVGADSVVDAVRRCWASLWTERAASYRETNGIDHETTSLAVVVQEMVQATVSGVMFTANPVTGRRDQIVIDASPGLGEAVVSGAVNPDHFVVQGDGSRGADAQRDVIVERRLGDKRIAVRSLPGGGTEQVESGGAAGPCLTDGQIAELARLGRRVAAHYGSPQDIEWAVDAAGTLHLTQSRPITTLFPLPERDGFHVYFSFTLAQGLEQPITPMGRAAFREIAKAAKAIVLGNPASRGYVEAGERIFLDITNVMRSRTGRAFVTTALGYMEARSAEVLRELAGDPRLALTQTSPLPAIRRVLRLARRFDVPRGIIRALVDPERAVGRARRMERELLELAGQLPIEQALRECTVPFAPRVLPSGAAGFLMLALADRLVRTEPGELQTVLRGLPHNVTTEMDMALWDVAAAIRRDPIARQAFENGERPAVFEEFLARWGHRAVAEIDLGVPRWSDDPAHLVGVVRNYLRVEDENAGADALFARGAAEAEAMIDTLARRARGRGPLVRFTLRRARSLVGLREYPKYLIITLIGALRPRIAEIGRELHAHGRIASPDDVFFLDFTELRSAGGDLRPVVAQRRERYAREMRRRHVPRVLLSDGTEPEARLHRPAGADALTGTPASAGTVTGIARVVMNPVGAHLDPGEILVAPSTDPGWTPLFLTAGGLVMEMGGANSHGAVVAREYGIPAVVGVREAVTRIETGDRITVDGGAGTVTPDRDTTATSPPAP